MTNEEFMEFYAGGGKYVHFDQQRSMLNTDTILDKQSYGKNVFQMSLEHTAHDGAARLVCSRIYRDVLFGKEQQGLASVFGFSEEWTLHGVSDLEIWDGPAGPAGPAGFPGLHHLTHAKCLGVLIETKDSVLDDSPHEAVYSPRSLGFETPVPWFFRASHQLRECSILHFRCAAIAIHYHNDSRITPSWVADALGITEGKLLSIWEEAKTIIDRFVIADSRNTREKADSLDIFWEEINGRFMNGRIP